MSVVQYLCRRGRMKKFITRSICLLFLYITFLLFSSVQRFFSFVETEVDGAYTKPAAAGGCQEDGVDWNEWREETDFRQDAPPKHSRNARLDDRWLAVDGCEQGSVYVYSGYWDNRDESPIIRVLGIARPEVVKATCFYCHVYDEGGRHLEQGNKLMVLNATVQFLPDDFRKKYYCIMITCLTACYHFPKPPKFIAVSSHPYDPAGDSNSKLQHLLPMRPTVSTSPPKHNFTVCVSAMFNNYGDTKTQFIEFIQFMEISSIFGASNFRFFNHSVGKSLEGVLNQYIAEGLVNLVQWNLPVYAVEEDTKTEIHYFGQVIQLHDCLYKSMADSRYLAVVDFDEVFVPLHGSSWNELIFSMNCHQVSPASYIFRNAYFPKEWTPDPAAATLPVVQGQRLTLLTYTRRDGTILEQKHRCKYMVVPHKIVITSVHYPVTYYSGYEVPVDPENALMFHFRNRGIGDPQNTSVLERRMWDFKDELVARVVARAQQN